MQAIHLLSGKFFAPKYLSKAIRRSNIKLSLLISGRSRRFIREYSLPLAVTLALILMVGVIILVRASEQASLASWLIGVSGEGEDYATLLSKDKADDFKKNDDTGEPNQPSQTTSTSASSSNSGSFAVNPGNPTNPSPTGGSATTPPPANMFTASIANFRQSGETLECTSPKPNKGVCSKRYTFTANINTQNGPGRVDYSWRSNLESANEETGFTAGSGNVSTFVQKEIVLDCNDQGSYSLQVAISSPNQTQSGVITINNVCLI